MARSKLEDGKQSEGGGKKQDQQPEGAVGLAAGVGEKLGGKEKEHQVRRQEHQGLAGLRRVEREPGRVLDDPQEKKQRDGDVGRRPDRGQLAALDGEESPQEKSESADKAERN